MEGVEKILTIEEVAEQMLRCKLDVYHQIEKIKDRLEDGTVRMDEIETILDKHEKQREINYVETKESLSFIRGEMQSYRNDFNQHDKHFHVKLDEMASVLQDITDKLNKTMVETDANTLALNKRRKQDEIDEAVQKALEEDHKPYNEYKKQAIMAIVGVVSVAVAAGTWKLIVFVSELDKLMMGTPQ